MNAEHKIQSAGKVARPVGTHFLRAGLAPLRTYSEQLDTLEAAVSSMAKIGDRVASRNATKLQRQVRKFEPTVTMIGQVKAGKTSLVNALVGWPDLLPADVNPWTSVVTSLHISPRPVMDGQHAKFRFFEEDEWTRLLERGGRIGELAGRVGAEDELQKVTKQLQEMREKSRRRLGDKFELLMGQEHGYGYFDAELIQRYVCLGDDFESDTETSSSQGRFADITKSADLYFQREEFPVDFCIRDTPGVNDTFMMREQITIRAIRESRMCVVVLSAHQALSSVDMALIRLISNLPSRDVVIFVNRIDELTDPSTQVPEIEARIRETLRDHQGPEDAAIMFGSAYWANHVLRGTLDQLDQASQEALFEWAQATLGDHVVDHDPEDMVWHLSGVPKLLAALGDRAVAGPGREALAKSAKSALNILSGMSVSQHVVSMRSTSDSIVPLERKALPAEIYRIERESLARLDRELDAVVGAFNKRVERSHRSFVERATGALIKSFERYGDLDTWQYDATGLRVILRSALQVFATASQNACQKVFLETAAELRELYLRAFNVPDAAFQLEAPSAPFMQPPVMLGQTIALDLSSNWWSRWWRKQRGANSYATEFAAVIHAETLPIVDGLKAEYVGALSQDARKILSDFIRTQRETLKDLAEQSQTTIDDLQDVGILAETQEKTKALEECRAAIQAILATQCTELVGNGAVES